MNVFTEQKTSEIKKGFETELITRTNDETFGLFAKLMAFDELKVILITEEDIIYDFKLWRELNKTDGVMFVDDSWYNWKGESV